MRDAAAAMMTVRSMQMAFQVLQTVTPMAWRFPTECDVTPGSSFDFLVVGGGSAGSVVASRLTENATVNVLLIEAGGYPPLESQFPGWFTYMSQTPYDFNFTSVNDNVTAQNLQGKVVGMRQGRMLGGSGGLHHMMHTHGDPEDYNNWARILNDSNWSYSNIRKYFKKMENCVDEDILNSTYASLHGTDGPLKIARETYPSSKKYLKAFAELGHKIKLDVSSSESAVGVVESLFEIADEIRQSASVGYLGLAKSRPNLCLGLSLTATKVLINEKGMAYGVQVTNSSGETFEVYANKEVILSAGAINTPKLLMMSGIGPKEHLTSLSIDVVADLPVGENLQDHPCAVILYQLDECDKTKKLVSNPCKFAAPSFNSYVSLNSSQPYADYESINLDIQCNSDALIQLCVNEFKYSYDICEKMYGVSKERNTMYSVVGLVMPDSRGKVRLASKDPAVDPLIYLGTLSDKKDMDLLGVSLMDHNRILNTTYFKSVDAKVVDFGVCADAKTELEFWKCYGVEMSVTMWHYAGTAAMGLVVDSNLQVYGVKSLRVIDSAAMPTLIRGKICAGVILVAERGADIVQEFWNI